MIDDESWYSVTPEPMAKHIAKKIANSKEEVNSEDEKIHEEIQKKYCVLDAFCGVGGNLIQFAKKGYYTIGCDLDIQKI